MLSKGLTLWRESPIPDYLHDPLSCGQYAMGVVLAFGTLNSGQPICYD